MKTVVTGQIVGLRKLHNSKMGNPKFLVRIWTPAETFDIRTASDAGFAYAITDRYLKKYATFVISGEKRQTLTDIKLDQEQ